MSRILVAFLAMAMAQWSVSWGTEPYQPYGYGTAFDPFAAPPPSGLRFSGMDTTIRTGGPVGDPGAAWGGGPCSSCGGGDMHIVETLSALVERAHQIDSGVGAFQCGANGVFIAHIGLAKLDLAHMAHRDEIARRARPPHADAQAVARPGQCPHRVTAHKARAAENRDERVFGHVLFRCMSRRKCRASVCSSP